jgi:hypothetical protein
MKKTSRVSRRRKSISGSRRYKKGKTANKKRVKRVSSSTRRWISGGKRSQEGGGSILEPVLNVLKNTRINLDGVNQIIKTHAEFIKGLPDTVLDQTIKSKISAGDTLDMPDIITILSSLYDNRNNITDKNTLLTILEKILEDIIEKLPPIHRAIAGPILKGVISILRQPLVPASSLESSQPTLTPQSLQPQPPQANQPSQPSQPPQPPLAL